MPNTYIKDSFRNSVEKSSGGRMTVLYDDLGYPSIMYRIPIFRICDKIFYDWSSNCNTWFVDSESNIDNVINSLCYQDFKDNSSLRIGTAGYHVSTDVSPDRNLIGLDNSSIHPAFNLDGSNYAYEIYVGAYKSSWMGEGRNKRLVSLPNRIPAQGTFNELIDECFKKNMYYDGSTRCEGWHMMTGYEYSAIVFDALADGRKLYNTYNIASILETAIGEDFGYPQLQFNDLENLWTYDDNFLYTLKTANTDNSTAGVAIHANQLYKTGQDVSESEHDILLSNKNSLIGVQDFGVGGLEYIDGVWLRSYGMYFWSYNIYHGDNIKPVLEIYGNSNLNQNIGMGCFRNIAETVAPDVGKPEILTRILYNRSTTNSPLGLTDYSCFRYNDTYTINDWCSFSSDIAPSNYGDVFKYYPDVVSELDEFFVQSSFSDSSFYAPVNGHYLGYDFEDSKLFAILLFDGEFYRKWCKFNENYYNDYSDDRIFLKYTVADNTTQYCVARGGDIAWNPYGGPFSYTALKPDERTYRTFRPLQWTFPVVDSTEYLAGTTNAKNQYMSSVVTGVKYYNQPMSLNPTITHDNLKYMHSHFDLYNSDYFRSIGYLDCGCGIFSSVFSDLNPRAGSTDISGKIVGSSYAIDASCMNLRYLIVNDTSEYTNIPFVTEYNLDTYNSEERDLVTCCRLAYIRPRTAPTNNSFV